MYINNGFVKFPPRLGREYVMSEVAHYSAMTEQIQAKLRCWNGYVPPSPKPSPKGGSVNISLIGIYCPLLATLPNKRLIIICERETKSCKPAEGEWLKLYLFNAGTAISRRGCNEKLTIFSLEGNANEQDSKVVGDTYPSSGTKCHLLPHRGEGIDLLIPSLEGRGRGG